MTKEEFIKDLEWKANVTTHIKERAKKLFDKLEPILNEEDKKTAKECLVEFEFPKENEVCIKWFVPQEWLLNEQFQQMLWEWYCMTNGGSENESRQ